MEKDFEEDFLKLHKLDMDSKKAIGNCLGVAIGFISALVICFFLSMCDGRSF